MQSIQICYTRYLYTLFKLPFATIGSLNGVHMFCKSQGVNIKTTYMDDGLIVWREFENCVTMIGAAKGIAEEVLITLLEYAFDALIFCISLSELKHNKNVEQLKRELKVSCLLILLGSSNLLQNSEQVLFLRALKPS